MMLTLYMFVTTLTIYMFRVPRPELRGFLSCFYSLLGLWIKLVTILGNSFLLPEMRLMVPVFLLHSHVDIMLH